MENPTPGVTGADKSPDQLEQEMTQTRESITEKVALLESQVMGNIQSVTSGVTDAVQSVKDAVTGAPGAVKDTVKQTVAAVKDTVRETVDSIDITGTVRANPWAAVGTSVGVGFVVGLLIPGGRPRSIMARGNDEPVSGGQVGTARTAYQGYAPARDDRPSEPGLFGGLWAMIGKEVRQLAEQALNTATASVKQTIKTQVPQAVDTAVHGLTDRVAAAANGIVGGTDLKGTARVGGPNYTATPPAGGL